MPSTDEPLISPPLSDAQRYMLFYGLVDWQGPSECTPALAIAMGFSGLEELEQDGRRIAEAIHAGRGLTVLDWSRALVSTEFIFASDVFGTGREWTTIHGYDDAYWIDVLRSLQTMLPLSSDGIAT